MVHLDVLRIVAVFAVVLLHVAAPMVLKQPLGSSAWHVANVYDSAVRFCVPVLVMLSGVLFLDPNRPVATSKLFTKYLPRIVAAFLFWSAVYVVFDQAMGIRDHTLREALERVIPAPGHLWYLYMIAGLYLMVPLLRPLAASLTTMRYFLGLWVVFGLLGQLLRLLPQPLWDPFQAGLATANVNLVVGYSGYFMLGAYLAQNPLGRRAEALAYVGGVVGFVVTALATWHFSEAQGSFAGQYYAYLTPNVALVTVAVFVLFNQRVSLLSFSERAASWIVRLSACTFGIYLVHMLFLNELLRRDVFPLAEHPVVSVAAMTLTVFVLSLVVTTVLRRIPWFRTHLS